MTDQDYADAEKMVLGVLAQEVGGDKEMTASVFAAMEQYGVRAEWFRAKAQRHFYVAALKTWRATGDLDALHFNKAFNAEAEGEYAFADTFEALMEATATRAHLEYYLGALKQKVIYGIVHKLLTEAMKELKPDDIGVQIEDFMRKLHDVQEDLAETDGGLKQLGDYMAESVAKKMTLHEERFVKHNWAYLDGLPWPWKEVDQIFSGLKTGLHILAALASQGKSTMAANLSVFWNERGIKHGFFSIDMAADQLADRYPCIMNRVSLAKLNFGTTKDEVRRFQDGYEKNIRLNNVWLSEVDDVKTMEYQCYRGVKSLGWKAIIIDYIQLVSPEEKGNMPEYTRVQRAVQAVKKIAKRLKVPVVCLAQLSRQFEKDLREKGFAPGLDAIGDSAEIARAAASVTCLYQDEEMRKYWAQEPPTQLAFGDRNDMAIRYGVVDVATEGPEQREARQKGQVSLAKQLRPVWFDVKKNQQGRCGKVPFVMFPNYFLFRPGNSDGGKVQVTVDGKAKMLPVQMFEQLRDDWTYTEQDWWLEMTNALPQRGVKLMGETYEQMAARLEEERKAHPEVKHFADMVPGGKEL